MQFEVKEVSKKFDKVTRLACRLTEEGYEMGLDLDINSDLFALENNDRFVRSTAPACAPTLSERRAMWTCACAPFVLARHLHSPAR